MDARSGNCTGRRGPDRSALAGPHPADDGSEHFGQLGADHQEPLPVGLGRGDVQQWDDLAGGGQGVGDHAAMGELEHLLDPGAGVPQHLDDCPRPEGVLLLKGEVASRTAFWSSGIDDAGATFATAAGVGGVGKPAQPFPGRLEDLARCCGDRRRQQLLTRSPAALGGGHQGGQDRGQLTDALVHTRGGSALLLVLTHEVPPADRVRCCPRGPAARILQGPVGHVGVEGPHRHQDGVGVLAEAAEPVVAIADVAKALLPASCHLVGKVQRVDAGLVQLQVPPEQQHQFAGQLADRGVVHPGLALVQVVDQEVPHRDARDLVAVDELLDAELAPSGRRVDGGRGIGRHDAGLEQQSIPMRVLAGAVADLGPVGLDAVAQRDVGEQAAVVGQHPGQLEVGEVAVQLGEAFGRLPEGIEPGEAGWVPQAAEPLEELPRPEPVEPVVGGPDGPHQDQPARPPGELGPSVFGPEPAGNIDVVHPALTGLVRPAGPPPLLPGVAWEALEPVKDQADTDEAAAKLLGLFGRLQDLDSGQ